MPLPLVRTVAMSGCGWLFPFHVGVVDVLVRRGVVNEGTQWAGTSAGALVAAAMASGVGPDQIMALAASVCDSIRQKNASHSTEKHPESVFGSIRSAWAQMAVVVEEALLQVLPGDAHERCAGRLSIALTPLKRRFDPWLHRRDPILITEFESRDDLIGALMCSSHIPFYLDGQYSRQWRGTWWVDGGFADIFPEKFTQRRRERARAGYEALSIGTVIGDKVELANGGDATIESVSLAEDVDDVTYFSGVLMSCPYREISDRMISGFLIGPGSPLSRKGARWL